MTNSLFREPIRVLYRFESIKREYSKEDERSFCVAPTDTAKELVKSSTEKMSRYLQQIESTLGTEAFETLLNIVDDTNKILSNLEGEAL